MVRVIDFWIDCGVDGFRLDAVPFLIKREGTSCVHLPETHNILKNIRKHIDSSHKGIVLLAEANGAIDQVKAYFGNGDECHLAFNFYLMPKMFLALHRGDKAIAEEAAKETLGVPKGSEWVTFLRSHDDLPLSNVEAEERSELLEAFNNEEIFGFKGNHGIAKRLATLFKGDVNKVVEAFELLFSLPGSPVIYYGDEIGLKNISFEEPLRDSRRYLRGEFDWGEARKQIAEENSLLNRVIKIVKSKET